MDIKKTITSIFMVPPLGINKEDLKENNFLNAYIKDARKEIQYKDCIYLLFQPSNVDKFRFFLDSEYVRTDQLIDDYDYEDGFVVTVYKLDGKYKEDFEFIKVGKYSLTSKMFQSKFPKIVKIIRGKLEKEEISLQYRIFNKTDDLVQFWQDKLDVAFTEEQEVWGGFFEEDETLDLDKIKELCLIKS